MSLRWAARYAFTEDLWRSKARVVLDPALEDALLGGLPRGDDAEALRDLVDALLPARAGDDAQVWMGVRDEDVATRLGRLRGGTTFVPADRLADVLGNAPWEAALLDLDAAAGSAERESTPHAAIDGLGLRADAARSVVVWASAGESGVGYDELADAMLDRLHARGSTQRIYGLYQPPMAAVVDFGESLEVDGGEGDLEITLTVRPSERVAPDEDIPLYFDNSLGAEDPAMLELIGVSSTTLLPEGLGLVELPQASAGQASGIRAQLASAQERAQRAEVERQTLLERVDALTQERRSLQQQLASTSETDAFDALARDEALEASMAREQALKWKVTGLEHQLSQAIARPVEALEAEVARLSSLPGQDAPTTPTAKQPPVAGEFEAADLPKREARANDEPDDTVVVLVTNEARDRALATALGALVARLERGGIGVLALRREISAVARRLRTR